MGKLEIVYRSTRSCSLNLVKTAFYYFEDLNKLTLQKKTTIISQSMKS